MTGVEFGVVSAYADGSEQESWGWSEAAAAAFVRSNNTRSWYPRPVRAVRRVVGVTEPLLTEEETA